MISSTRGRPSNERRRDGCLRVLAAAAALLLPLRVVAQSAGLTVQIPSSELTATASAWYSSSLSPDKTADENSATYVWITGTSPATWLQFDLGYGRWVSELEIYATQNRIRGYEVYVSNESDPADWGAPVASGELLNTTAYHPISCDFTYGRYVRLIALSGWGSRIYVYEARLHESSFQMADKQTGHRGYTNSNRVDVTSLPVMTGYDAYQITESATEPVGGWLPYASTNAPVWLEADLGSPDEEAVVTRYAWFKDQAAGTLPTTNAPASIIYVRDNADVEAVVVASLSAPSWGASMPADVRLSHVDDGSSSSIGIYSAVLSVAPDEDLTPDDPHRITLADTGSYMLTLTVTDNAGNVDTATCPLTVFAGSVGQTTRWTGAGDGSDWHDNFNWSNYAPGPGAHVALTNAITVLLNSPTPVLASLTVSNNATLVFTNWNTTLNAGTVTVGAKGTVTCAAPYRDDEMSNRVWIVCGDLAVRADGQIEINGKGFAGGEPYPNPSVGYGPGGGGVGSGTGGGGGYGGFGYGAGGVAAPGVAYGDPFGPIFPGSGGGGSTDTRKYAGSAGGGVVRIDAAGMVVVDGLISANGGNAPNRGGAGSGGGVLIRCGSFTGTNGVICAIGGTSGFNGYGGGGRIAVVPTNLVAQANLKDHRVTFSTMPGAGDRVEMLGSLYVAQASLLDGTWLPHYAVVFVSGASAWAMESMAVTGWVQVKPYDEDVFFTLGVVSNITIAGPAARVDLYQTLLTVGGSMTITNGGRVFVYSSACGAPSADYGALVDVAGDISVATNSWMYPQSDGITGTSVLFRCANVLVNVGGGINADGRGWAGVTGEGAGVGGSWGSGGGYGGKGGDGSNGAGGSPYGSALLPLLPGSGGGRYGTPGGGVIRLDVNGHMRLDGILTACGPVAVSRQGAGSGGAILVQCRTFEAGAAAVLDASGGGTGSVETGGGGGGRIAVWTGDRYTDALPESRLVVSESVPDDLSERVLVNGGVGGYAAGDSGTVRFIRVLYTQGTLLLLR